MLYSLSARKHTPDLKGAERHLDNGDTDRQRLLWLACTCWPWGSNISRCTSNAARNCDYYTLQFNSALGLPMWIPYRAAGLAVGELSAGLRAPPNQSRQCNHNPHVRSHVLAGMAPASQIEQLYNLYPGFCLGMGAAESECLRG